jgi:hypothetical protein
MCGFTHLAGCAYAEDREERAVRRTHVERVECAGRRMYAAAGEQMLRA